MLLAVGSLAFDTVTTPSGKVDNVLGGSLNYFAIAASLTEPLDIVGVVGSDFPAEHLAWLRSRGIGTNGIQVMEGKTFHWEGSYDGRLQEARTHQTELNVLADFDPQLSPTQKAATAVFLANIDPVLQMRVIDQVQAPGLIMCDSMNYWIASKRPELEALLARVDIVCFNEQEVFALTGKGSLRQAAKAIQYLGPSIVIVKRGEYGAMLFYQDSVLFVPAYLVDAVVDPTGAGDSFAGGFFASLHKHDITIDTLRRALIQGSVISSFTVEDFSFRRLGSIQIADVARRTQALLAMY